jgi:hypothetical protein
MDPSVVTDAGKALVAQGLPGIVIVMLLFALGVLWKAYSNANEARIKAEDEVRDKYVGLLEKVMGALNDNNTILQIVKDRMGTRQ